MRCELIIVIGTVAVRPVDAELCSRHAFHSVIGCYLPDDMFLAFKPKMLLLLHNVMWLHYKDHKAFPSFTK